MVNFYSKYNFYRWFIINIIVLRDYHELIVSFEIQIQNRVGLIIRTSKTLITTFIK